MNLQEYQPYWNSAKPLMTAKLEEIRANLTTMTDLRVSDITEGGDEEFRLTVDLYRADDVLVVGLDFTLHDAEVHGCEPGVGVSLSVTGYGALVLGGYSPYAYSEQAYTSETEEMENRIQALDTGAFVAFVVNEALKDEALKRELAKA